MNLLKPHMLGLSLKSCFTIPLKWEKKTKHLVRSLILNRRRRRFDSLNKWVSRAVKKSSPKPLYEPYFLLRFLFFSPKKCGHLPPRNPQQRDARVYLYLYTRAVSWGFAFKAATLIHQSTLNLSSPSKPLPCRFLILV